MNHLLNQSLLFAQRSRLDGIANNFRGRAAGIDRSDIANGVLVLAIIVLVVWLLSYMLSTQERRKPFSSPLMLFLSLCRAHRLNWRERWLLWRVARSQRLRDAARIFIEPERFEPINLSPVLRMRAEQLEYLRGQLFAGCEDARESADSPETAPAEPVVH